MSKYTEIIPDDIELDLGWLLPYLKPNKKFLDVGCSTGYFGSFIKDHARVTVDGIEISNDKLEAKKVLNNVFSFDLDNKWPSSFTKYKYDYVLFGDVLEHLKNPQEILEKIKPQLNTSGYVFVSIPNIAHISTRLELINGSFEYEDTGILDNTHLQYFTLHTFTQIAQKAGFDIVEVNYSYNDFPESIINKLLLKAGLKPTKKFWEIVNSKEARAYQYKFIIQVAKTNPTNTKYQKLLEKPEHFRDSFIKDLQSQITAIDKHAKEQALIIKNKDIQIDKLLKKNTLMKRLINNIKRSKFVNSVRPTIHRIKNIKNK